MTLPEPFQRVIEIDRRLAQPVVSVDDIKARRQARRMCQVYLKSEDTIMA